MAAPPDPLTRFYRRIGAGTAWAIYAFLMIPSLLVVPISFGRDNNITFPPQGFSLTLYRAFFSAQSWTEPLLQSGKVAALTTALALLISVPASYGMVRTVFPGKQLVVVLLMSPVAIPVIVVALGLYLYFSLLGLTGTTIGLVIAHTVYVAPFVIVTIAAGVRKLDPRLEFAATLMGASRRRVFATVVMPQLGASILAGALFAFLLSFDEVVLAWFLTGARTVTLPVKMYSAIQWEVSPVIAAVSTLLTTLSLVACVLAAVLQRPAEGT